MTRSEEIDAILLSIHKSAQKQAKLVWEKRAWQYREAADKAAGQIAEMPDGDDKTWLKERELRDRALSKYCFGEASRVSAATLSQPTERKSFKQAKREESSN